MIQAVDNHPVTRFGGMNGSVQWYVARSEDKTIPFKVNRDGQQLTFNPIPPTQEAPSGWQRKSLRQVSIDPAYTAIVAKVEPGSPAEKAGLQEKDVVTAVNGQKIYNPLGVSDFEQNHYGQPIALTVERGGQTLQKTLSAMQFRIGGVVDGSPADKAGLKAKRRHHRHRRRGPDPFRRPAGTHHPAARPADQPDDLARRPVPLRQRDPVTAQG